VYIHFVGNAKPKVITGRHVRLSPDYAVIVRVVFKDKFRRLEAILAEWCLVRVVESSAMSWETIFVLTGVVWRVVGSDPKVPPIVKSD
jgi:hypothetical protein